MTKKEQLETALKVAQSLQVKIQQQMADNLRLQGEILKQLAWTKVGKKQASVGDLATALYDVKRDLGFPQPFFRSGAVEAYSAFFESNKDLN